MVNRRWRVASSSLPAPLVLVLVLVIVIEKEARPITIRSTSTIAKGNES
jgi:hypothetical protein